jgi:hypothetical protein
MAPRKDSGAELQKINIATKRGATHDEPQTA